MIGSVQFCRGDVIKLYKVELGLREFSVDFVVSKILYIKKVHLAFLALVLQSLNIKNMNNCLFFFSQFKQLFTKLNNMKS